MTTEHENAEHPMHLVIDEAIDEAYPRMVAEMREAVRQWPELAASQDKILDHMLRHHEMVRAKAHADVERQLRRLDGNERIEH